MNTKTRGLHQSPVSSSLQPTSNMASKVHVLPLDHEKMKMGYADGIHMAEVYEPVAEHLPKVKAMEVQDGDVFLCTYPKAGTHWLYRVIDMLQRGKAVYDSRTADSTFIDVQKIELLPTLDAPRVFVSHLPFDRLPDQIRSKRAKIVHVYRNPRAVLVSYWFMIKDSMLKLGTQDFTLQQMYDMFFSEQRWFKHADSVKAYQGQYPDVPLYNLAYEDMSQNPTECVSKLNDFLGTGASAQLIANIVTATAFKQQKATEELDPKQKALKFHRKGEVDDWKNYLTDDMKAAFTKILQDRAPHCPISARYV